MDNYSPNPRETFLSRHKVKLIAIIMLLLLAVGVCHYQSTLNGADQLGPPNVSSVQLPALNSAVPTPTPIRKAVMPTKLPPLPVHVRPVQKVHLAVQPVATKHVSAPIKKPLPSAKPIVPAVKTASARLRAPASIAQAAVNAPITPQPYFTLQLMASPNKAHILRYIHQHKLSKMAYVTAIAHHRRTWYRLNYGHFSTPEAALSAGGRLKQQQPHLMPLLVSHAHHLD